MGKEVKKQTLAICDIDYCTFSNTICILLLKNSLCNKQDHFHILKILEFMVKVQP